MTEADARRFRAIVDGQTSAANVEASAFDPDTESELMFQYFPTGYVHSDDWQDVDADQFLSQMQANDEVANRDRVAKGLLTLRTVGWLQRPTLNNDTHTVSWVIEGAASDGSRVINAVALKLGRSGIERITWIASPGLYVKGRDDLHAAERAHQFDAGSRYVDYVAATDHRAEYGIAGLVAGALGVKLFKAGALAGLLAGVVLAMKKGAFLILLPVIWLGRKVVGLLKGRPS